MNTYIVKEGEHKKQWVVIDAKGKTLGRLASKIAQILIGKHKPVYSPHQDNGDGVIVINARHVKVSGKKMTDKVYTHYTGYPGGLRQYSMKRLLEKKPEELINRAVKRMLPHNNLGRKIFKHLMVYADGAHKQQAQQPAAIDV